MVRLEKIKAEAEQFIRARLTRIDDLDLKRFVFDHDLTFVVFFLHPDGGIYGRYGGRDAKSAESRQSLPGLRHAMRAALDRHRDGARPVPVLNGRKDGPVFQSVQQYPSARRVVRRDSCFHCHEVKEVMIDHLRTNGKWEREMAWRYPLPERLGFSLEVDRGDVVASVRADSAAEKAGLRRGDVLEFLGGAAVASQADAQYGLDHAPWKGKTEVIWRRGGEKKVRRAQLQLKAGWKRDNLLWRASMVDLVPVLDLEGKVLDLAERKPLGIPEQALAFKIDGFVPPPFHRAGIRVGDVIVELAGEQPGNLDSEGIDAFVGTRFQRGDRLEVELMRGKERNNITVQFGEPKGHSGATE